MLKAAWFVSVLALALVGQQESPRDLSHETIELSYNPSVKDIRLDSNAETLKNSPLCATAVALIKAPCRYRAPLEAATEVHVAAGTVPVYGWAELSKVRNGTAVAARLDDIADSAALGECDAAQCRAVVHVRDRGEQDRRLATCAVLRDGNRVAGAPTDCLLARVSAAGTTWLRVLAGYDTSSARSLGLPDFELALLDTRKVSLGGLLEQIRTALTHAPLELTAKSAGPDIVTGFSEYKLSTVLARFRPPLRELATVRVDLRPEENDARVHGMRVLIATNLLVNPQATAKREDWQLPTPPQESAYSAAVLEIVRNGLAAGCTSALWRSDRVLTCNMPSEAELPRWASR